MHDPFVVRVLERLANLGNDRQRLLRLELAAGDQLPEVRAVDELHDEIVHPAGLAEVVHRDDVRVAQSRERPGLTGESLGEPRGRGDVGRQDLERHGAVQPALASLVHRPHSTMAE